MNCLIGWKDRKPTKTDLSFCMTPFKKPLRTSPILSFMHVSDLVLSHALEIHYVPTGGEKECVPNFYKMSIKC